MKNNIKTLKSLWYVDGSRLGQPNKVIYLTDLEASEAEIQEKLKAMPLSLLSYERGFRDALKEVLGIECNLGLKDIQELEKEIPKLCPRPLLVIDSNTLEKLGYFFCKKYGAVKSSK